RRNRSRRHPPARTRERTTPFTRLSFTRWTAFGLRHAGAGNLSNSGRRAWSRGTWPSRNRRTVTRLYSNRETARGLVGSGGRLAVGGVIGSRRALRVGRAAAAAASPSTILPHPRPGNHSR